MGEVLNQGPRGSMNAPSPTSPSVPVDVEGVKLRDMIKVLRAYEAWEADIIMNADWSGYAPRISDDQWDEFIRIQGLRNVALSALRVADAGFGLPQSPAPAAERLPVVKALRWRRKGDDHTATTDVGRYEVGLVHGRCIALLRRVSDDGQWEDIRLISGPGLEMAKAAAQADYERRILLALDIPEEGAGHKAAARSPDIPEPERVEEEWWRSRLPQSGETEQQAIERLHRSPGYGGSFEDARAAVWDAIDFARARSSLRGGDHG